jgi:hypothetical protein
MTGDRAGITPRLVTRAVSSAPPRNGAETVPSLADDLLGRQCIRCGAVGTHYLTCPGLRLPSGYRVSDVPPA